ncbi:hypothetical protein [Agarivorans sp. 1_MG-2023]|uniref:hypothetical protein n=1 Tax=Agarivorans sp. 1_MG-2023 TaxID=3062634 RepID=UPI0026E389D1|nr:hypothetical protein [Agarivorans sp. 1_MG-2023]MDO6762133.1 hypothetical protein [Agarivorans sp. 1_MG-2023]
MSLFKLIIHCSILPLIVSCGGSSTDNDNPVKTFKGKAIDGYIIGATVFLDLNFNSLHDSGEPSVVTQEEGEFELVIPSRYGQCAQYVPIVVDVPVGAIDTDFVDTPIEYAYSMVLPPPFALTTNHDLLNLTPLTSVVWKQVEQELRVYQSGNLSCQSIIAEQELREDIAHRLREQEWRIANRYNITVSELYADYIHSGDESLHQLAQKLVPGLQKSYEETKQLLDEHPNADFAWVEYFLGRRTSNDSRYDDWFRYEFIQSSNGNFTSETFIMSDDLNTKVSLFDKNTMTTVQRDGVNIEKTVNLVYADFGYGCSISEWLETTLQQSSGLRNSVYYDVNDWTECESQMIVGSEVEQSLITKNYNSSELTSSTEHLYHTNNDSGFSYLIGVTDTVTQEDLTPIREKVNSDFYNEDSHGANYWSRTKNNFSESADRPAQVMTIHDSYGQWEQYTFYHDGTHKLECGDSETSMSDSQCTSTK